MAEMGGSEIQGISSPPAKKTEAPVADAVQKTVSPEVQPEIDPENNLSAEEVIKSFGDDLVEHVSKSETESIVREMGERFSIPQSAIEQGLKSEIFIIKNERFDKELIEDSTAALSEEESGEYSEILTKKYPDKNDLAKALREFSLKHEREAKENVDEKTRLAREEAESVGGIALPRETGDSVILVKEHSSFERKHTLRHELWHALAEGKDGMYSGFNQAIDAYLGGNNSNNLNEAATEILTLKMEYPDLPVNEMISKISKGEINAGYEDYVLKMLLIINATKQNENPFTINELAKYYLHEFKEENVAHLLKSELIGRIGPDMSGSVQQWLLHDLNDREKVKVA